jgi:PAS domain S-box-containing protein
MNTVHADQRASSRSVDEVRALLAAVVDSSDDAIVTKTLQGVITSWNRGAERLFGYTAAEAVGQPIFLIIPDDRKAEEEDVLARLQRGERIDHFETVRKAKDGRRIPISLTVSPIKNEQGQIIGASKVARDISDRLRAEELAEQRRVEEERIRLLTRRVLAQEDERRRIARELHDQLGQQLTALRLTLQALDAPAVDAGAYRVQIGRLQHLAEQLDEDVSFRVWELTPTVLDKIGLSDALRDYVTHWSQHFGIEVQLHIGAAPPDRLPSDVETTMYRLAQEALNNVVKHAKATRVDVVLEWRNGYATLIVEDNGVGFAVAGPDMTSRGLGLIGMRERASLVGADLQIESEVEQGTTIVLRVPLATEAAAGH